MRVFCAILKKTGIILLAVIAGLSTLIALGMTMCGILDREIDKTARILPSYPQTDIASILAKETWTAEDYDVLYRQTGLGAAALDAMKGDTERILSFQEALFYEGEYRHEQVAFTTKRDVFANGYQTPLADLEDGDVLVSAACHAFGWRHGHAAIVVDGAAKSVLESVSLGNPSRISYGGAAWFARCPNFIVLRLKDASQEERAAIAALAVERLLGVDYSIMVGVFSPKDQGETPQETQCAHLVWQAYAYFGYDIDADGGPVCTPRDIAMSDCFEIVQVSGFDPLALW